MGVRSTVGDSNRDACPARAVVGEQREVGGLLARPTTSVAPHGELVSKIALESKSSRTISVELPVVGRACGGKNRKLSMY